MKFFTWVFETGIDTGLISKVEKIAEDKGLIAGELEKGVVDPSYRMSEVCFIEDEELRNMLWKYILRANSACFGFDIIKDFEMQFTKYNSKDKGFYNWHTDNNFLSDSFFTRKLSVVIQLSDPSEYEGGVLELEIDNKVQTFDGFKQAGSIIVFPSFIKHRVTPVTKGVRKSLVAWVNGPNFR